MEPSITGHAFDPAKCSEMSLEEKRQFVYEISQSSESALDLLQSWTRRELLQLICAEMGKERKYTGVKKTKMIELLIKLISEKKAGNSTADQVCIPPPSSDSSPRSSKKQRRKDRPLQVPVDSSHTSMMNYKLENVDVVLCQNLVCKANMKPDDAFCKRCSCCICYRYDDNKDPSLWLLCGSDTPNQEDSCGMSYHLECVFKHDKAGLSKNGRQPRLDGGFYCVSCGKVNGLLRCWRKQILIAKDARRVDALCYRIALCQKILKGTKRYRGLNEIVNVAAKKLKEEVGPLHQVSLKMARGIVNRLSCGAEVQKLCSFAIEAVDCMLQAHLDRPVIYPTFPERTTTTAFLVRFEDISPTRIMVILELEDKTSSVDITGCKLWYRSAALASYPEEPMCIFLHGEAKFLVSDLDPSTEYVFKVAPFRDSTELGELEARWVTTEISSVHKNTSTSHGTDIDKVNCGSTLEEENVNGEHASLIQAESQRDSNSSEDNQASKLPKTGHETHSKIHSSYEVSDKNGCDMPLAMEIVPLTCSNVMAITDTPCKPDSTKEPPKSSKQVTEGQYEHCVKVVRWLECEGHMDKEFRVKFLTWFSLKATMQERRVVSVFVDTLIDDPASLAGQLIDAFSDRICSKSPPVDRPGFCGRLWH
ncbi:VIN3-like protein 2 [Nymphaea thermarum]|nr:VIN3-like protein 2 [Nymphaea thermarum]